MRPFWGTFWGTLDKNEKVSLTMTSNLPVLLMRKTVEKRGFDGTQKRNICANFLSRI
jgi:hypothetical protein